MNYRLAYALGFHPWEDLADHPPFADKLLGLVAREEEGREAPYGTALDIGTGSAVWGAHLAKRGWNVTGVDVVEKAGLRDLDEFARSWHILMKGSIISAGEGDAEAARRGQAMARLLIDRHR
jgi:hypothetical protein